MDEKGATQEDIYGILRIRLAEIRRKSARFTIWVLVLNLFIYGALYLWFGDPKRAGEVYTSTFQFQATTWACLFMFPYFLRMEVKNDIGLEQGRNVASTLASVKDELGPIIADAKAIVSDLRASLERYGGGDAMSQTVKEIRKELEAPGGVVNRLEARLDRIADALSAPIGGRPKTGRGLLETGIRGSDLESSEAHDDGNGSPASETRLK